MKDITQFQAFTFINNNNINNTSFFNIFFDKYKEIYWYIFDNRKNLPKNEDVLYLKVKYNLISYPEFLFLIFDLKYTDLANHTHKIFKLML